jgi:SAM-dependent methyltransferase
MSELVAWRFGGFGGIRNLLDFASGYGRTTRFFVQVLDPGRITIAEIDTEAVQFQTDAFGVRGCVSGNDPRDLALTGRFDLVLAVSFFSHLPESRFRAWLERLYRLVARGGMLVFSTHGEAVKPVDEALSPSGFAFRAQSETTRLAGHEYGTSWVTSEFVRRASFEASGEAGRLAVYPEGLCGYQDLYVLSKPPLPEGSDPLLAPHPKGALEFATIEDGVVISRGWAVGDRDERPPDVKLYFGERLQAVSPGTGEGGTRREWSFTFPASAVSPDCVVRIEAESVRGVARLLVAETLRPYIRAAAV